MQPAISAPTTIRTMAYASYGRDGRNKDIPSAFDKCCPNIEEMAGLYEVLGVNRSASASEVSRSLEMSSY